MWQQFADSGVMPHSAKLLKTGTLVPMKSALPEVSSAAWASIVTGQNSGGHNVFGFTDLMDGSYTLGFTSSRTFRAKPFWARDGAGPSLIMNVPQTYPAQPLNGMLVSGFVALDLKRAVYPAEQLAWLESIDYSVDADMSLVEKGKLPFVEELHRVMAARCEALHHHWDREPWQNVMFVFTGTDRLNHYLWEDYEDTSSPFYQTFLDYYHEVDRQIGRMLERLDDHTILTAVSDHGFARQRRSVNVNCLLAEGGFLQLRQSARPSYIDMLPETKAFAMDPGRIYLHRQGRYPAGMITSEAEDLMQSLTTFFQNATVDGQPIAAEVLRGREVYSGPFAHRAPDLIVMPAKDVALSGRMNLSDLVEPTSINGKHTYEESTFFVRGENLGQIPSDMKVENVLDVIMPAQQQMRRAA
jgi:predicted AlkP superfamily phosphohydrolase/phosphomutase